MCLSRNLDVHLADNSIGHQKLTLKEIHQLRSENDKLRDAAKNLKRRDKKVWILLALVVLGIAILVSYLHTERDRMNVNEHSIQSNKRSIQFNEHSIQSHEHSMQSNKQSIQSNKQSMQSSEHTIQSNKQSIQLHEHSIQSHEQSIQSNKHSIQSNKQFIQSNKHSIQSNDQSIRFLMSNATYLYDYIQDRDKTLQGVEWTHGNVGGERYYGPIFYLGTCKLRLDVYVSINVDIELDEWDVWVHQRDAAYHVTRLRGDEDDVTDICHITYVHLYSVNTADNSKYNERSKSVSKKLSVGDEYWINQSFYIFAGGTLPNRTIRIYFDIE